MRALLAVVGVLVAGRVLGCTGTEPTTAGPPSDRAVDVLEDVPHDPAAFTQGLELADGVLYEGTGLEGKSSIRRSTRRPGRSTEQVDLPADLFGEGITVAGDTIWQITWQDGVAIRRDRATLAEQQPGQLRRRGLGPLPRRA